MAASRLLILVLCGTLLLLACSRGRRAVAPDAAGPGWIGVQCQTRPAGAAGLPVATVDPDGPGARAGIRPGDILLSFGRSKLGSGDADTLTRLVTETPPGTQVLAVIQREGRAIRVRLLVAAKPAVAAPAPALSPAGAAPRAAPAPAPPARPPRESEIVFPK